MTYSCGMWENATTLLDAQLQKLDFHILQARGAEATSVLDIGCGWGSLMHRLKDEYGVRNVTGLTLSKAQAEWINSKPHSDCQVLLESWTQHQPTRPYDSIISIGAFEHFAKRHLSKEQRINIYRRFFLNCHRWLQKGGYLSLQTIGCGNMLRQDFSQFFEREIFPESDLPRLGEIAEAAECLFEIIQVRNDRLDYAITAREWRKNLKKHAAEALEITDKATVAKYEQYLGMVILGFEVFESMNLYRITFRRINKPREEKRVG